RGAPLVPGAVHARDGRGDRPDPRRMPLPADLSAEGDRARPRRAPERPAHRGGRHPRPGVSRAIAPRVSERPSVRAGPEGRRGADYYALNLANLLFGRIGLYGRLGRNLRDEQGLAYYAFSSLDARTAGGMWSISAGVNPANLGKAIESIRSEMDRLRTEPFTL